VLNWGEFMKRLRVVVSLITQDNDYQVEQAAAAEDAARRLGVDVEIVYADADSIQQSQQILKFVQDVPVLTASSSNQSEGWRCRKWVVPR